MADETTASKQAQAAALAQAQQTAVDTPAPSPASSETIPGGRYIVDGQVVDCWGRPLDEKGG